MRPFPAVSDLYLVVPGHVAAAYSGTPGVGMVAHPALQAAEIPQQTLPAVVVHLGILPEEETAFHSAASYHLEIHPAAEMAYPEAFLGSLQVVGRGEACRLVPLACQRVVRRVRLGVGSHEEGQPGRLGWSEAWGLSRLGLRRRRRM